MPIFSLESQSLIAARVMLKASKLVDFNVRRPSRKLKSQVSDSVVTELVNSIGETLKESKKSLKPEFSSKLNDIFKTIKATDPSIQELSSQVLKALEKCII